MVLAAVGLPGMGENITYCDRYIHDNLFLASGDVSIHTWYEERVQASLQLQQDQPQLWLRVSQDVQPRTDKCEGGG